MKSVKKTNPKTSAFALAMIIASGLASMTFATNYYVDNSIGNDNNTGQGTTAALAWKTLAKPSSTTFAPGDSILFKAGGVWDGELFSEKKVIGTAAKPIVFDKYGIGANPIIRGNGSGEVGAVQMRYNDFFEFNNFELTCANGAFGIKMFTSGGQAKFRGTVKNLTVHNVNGTKLRDAQKQWAGIVFKNGGLDGGSEIKILNCTVYDVKYNGIELGGHHTLPLPDVSNKSTNNRIVNCKIYNCGLNGIWLESAVNSIITGCTIYNCGTDNTQQSPSTTILLHGVLKVTVQNCEIYSNKKAAVGLDFGNMSSRECIIQSNYIHDNAGGIFNINTSSQMLASSGNFFRYNVCQNNGGTLFSLSNASGTIINNNTVYSTSTTSVAKGLSSTQGSTNNNFNNNIFLLNSSTSYDAGATWNYNCFFGTRSASEPTDPHKLTSDPQFKSAGSGSVGRSTADGYILKTTSPCINAGLLLTNPGTTDFWGNPIPHNGKMNIGAYDGTDGNSGVIRTGAHTLISTKESERQIQIINLRGQVVHTEKISGNQQLNLTDLAHGVYQVSSKTSQGIESIRIVK